MKKEHFIKEFEEMFNIDISSDDSNIHPPLVCPAHKAVFYRYRSCKQKGNRYTTNTVLFNFEQHTQYCTVCNPASVLLDGDHNYIATSPTIKCGRKRKLAAKGGPGRGNSAAAEVVLPQKQKLIEESHLEEESTRHDQINGLIETILSLEMEARFELLKEIISTITAIEQRQILRYFIQEVCHLQHDQRTLLNKYKDLLYLKSLNIDDYIASRDTIVRTFLDAISDQKLLNTSKGKYLYARTIENIYKLNKPNTVLPLGFLHNLNNYIVTGSKVTVNMGVSSGASGSYGTIQDWMDLQAQSPTICPDGDVANVFDNQQVLGSR
jgi:hypothetical protein